MAAMRTAHKLLVLKYARRKPLAKAEDNIKTDI
jgi:hypothetical protein